LDFSRIYILKLFYYLLTAGSLLALLAAYKIRYLTPKHFLLLKCYTLKKKEPEYRIP